MKQLLVDLRRWNKDLATTAIEAGVDTLLVEDAEPVRELGRIQTIAHNGDIIPGEDIFELSIDSTEEQNHAMEVARNHPVIVHTSDWTVIPLENMVAVSDHVIAAVHTEKEADIAMGVLEKGVAGILIQTDDSAVIRHIAEMVQSRCGSEPLVQLKVLSVTPVGMGDRVCVDTCSLMSDGEGMLVGNTSSGFFLVHAETLENPYVAPRPFRVNAGAVHAYMKVAGDKTAYLADIRIGDKVIVTSHDGICREVTVGRVKIEKRPLLLVEAEYEGKKVSVILQNAETIRLVRPDGSAISVSVLSPGDTIMGALEEGGRHFGIAIKESILEK